MSWHDWATVIVRPSFWWRLRFLFAPHDLMFCWGEDKWFTKGFQGEEFLSASGLPVSERHRLAQERPGEERK